MRGAWCCDAAAWTFGRGSETDRGSDVVGDRKGCAVLCQYKVCAECVKRCALKKDRFSLLQDLLGCG